MRGKRTDLPASYEGMEMHLLEALKRVETGQPQNERLAELAKKGKLKVNISTVAEEADVSRTLIGYDECRYRKVRSKILGEDDDSPIQTKTDLRSINADLRQINNALEKRFKKTLSENAAMLNRMLKLEEKYNDKTSEIERINARTHPNANEIVGLRIVTDNDKK